MIAVHIHAPQPTSKCAVATICPDCGKRTRMLSFFTPWYGYHQTCIKCGRQWQDGEWISLAFSRWARRENIEAARARFRVPI